MTSYKAMVVEDTTDWQERFRRYLACAGNFKIYLARSRLEAQQHLANDTFDIVVLDINLSAVVNNIDGLYVGNEIWQHHPQTKIIVVSDSENLTEYRNIFHFTPSFIVPKQQISRRDFVEKVQTILIQ